MKRHPISIFVAITFVVSALMWAKPGFGGELKLAHFLSTKHPFHNVMVNFGKELSTATNGSTTIRVFPGGALGANPVEQFNRAVDGVADLVFGVPGYTASIFPRMILAEYPGLVNNPYDLTKKLNSALDKGLFGKEFKRVKILSLWNISPGVLFTSKAPIRKLSDLKGLKIRTPSKSAATLIKAWGAVPVFTAITEMYNGLQTGVFDGALVDPGVAIAFRLTEISKYVTTGFDSFLVSFYIAMNRRSYSSLNPADRAALDKLSGQSLAKNFYDSFAGVTKAGLGAMSKNGREVIKLGTKEAAQFNKIADKVRIAAIADLDKQGVNASKFSSFLFSK